MSVNISKLWGNSKFSKMSKNSKLLYVFLCSNSYLNTVGVCSLDTSVILLQTGLTVEELRNSTRELISLEYIYVKKYNNDVYFIIPSHFSTMSNSESTIEKMKSDFKSLPKDLVVYLNSIGISIDKKYKVFVPPTEEEVIEFSLSSGYIVDAKAFIDYYERQGELKGINGWVDARGKRVRDWKGKMRNVWFKPENKVSFPKGAPKGFEYFYVIVNGDVCIPDKWQGGYPQSKNFLISKELQKEYERRSKNS